MTIYIYICIYCIPIVLEEAPLAKYSSYVDQYKVSVPEGRSGAYRVEKFEVPDQTTLENLRIMRDGRTPVSPGVYTRLLRDGSFNGPIMSDTEAEVWDIDPLFRRAKGRVLLNGLGLGVALKGVLDKPEVTSVDVVEISQDVINLVWPTYEHDPRAHIHSGDALTFEWPVGTHWDVVWHDIWPTICADHLKDMHVLHRKYGGRAVWQGSWCRYEMERIASRYGI